MSRLRALLFILTLTLIASFLIGCDASSEEAAAPTAAATVTTAPTATAAPTATVAPTATPEPTPIAESEPDSQTPSKSSEVPRMSVDELKERLDDGRQIVIVDTRAQVSYDIQHIPGAIWVPSANLPSPLDDVPLDQEIVLYCA